MDRQQRYENRCKQKKVLQQNIDRDERVRMRDMIKNEIAMDVSEEILRIKTKTHLMSTRSSNLKKNYNIYF